MTNKCYDWISRARFAGFAVFAMAATAIAGCASDSNYGGTTTSMSVGVGYGGYSGGSYGGYYGGYPPVVVVPPDNIGDGGNVGNRPDRPTTLPAEVNRPAQTAPMPSSRPSNVSRPTSRPSPRPAPRPMPRRR